MWRLVLQSPLKKEDWLMDDSRLERVPYNSRRILVMYLMSTIS